MAIINGVRHTGVSISPPFGRMMVFVDGENLVFRYQSMVENGAMPKPSVVHERNVYVWEPSTVQPGGLYNIIRATYYTSAVGDSDRIKEFRESIKRLSFDRSTGSEMPNHITPWVYKKERQSAKGKGVDIQMTVDILTHVHQDHIDTVYLISGDGDYLSVVNEIVRSGKQIYIAALSGGLNPQLRLKADKFVALDKVYFKTK